MINGGYRNFRQQGGSKIHPHLSPGGKEFRYFSRYLQARCHKSYVNFDIIYLKTGDEGVQQKKKFIDSKANVFVFNR